MHGDDHGTSGERKHLFGPQPSCPWLPNKHILPQVADTTTLATEHKRIGTNRQRTHAAFGHTRIELHYASILTVVRCRPTEMPTWVAALHAGGPSHRSGERGRRAADRLRNASWVEAFRVSIAAVIRLIPTRRQGSRSALERPSRPPRPPFLECRQVLFKKASYGCTNSLEKDSRHALHGAAAQRPPYMYIIFGRGGQYRLPN